MSTQKTGFVGSAEAELTVTKTFTDIVVSLDLGVPQAPAFSLKLPLEQADGREGIFDEMLGATIEHVIQFFRHAGVSAQLLQALKDTLVKAATEMTTDDEADRSGSGGSTLLDAILRLEPVDVFEVKFRLPEGIIPAIHQKVVTAAAKACGIRHTRLAAQVVAEVREALSGKPIFKPVHRTPPSTKLPHNFQTNQNPTTLTQARPSLRDLIRKFKPQQGKKLTGPLFVLVYDTNGRPVGVRSIKGPGWAGISGKIAYNPASPEVQSTSLGLMMRLKQMGVRGVKLRQSPTGSFYLWFIGPASQIERKIRISDHPKLVQDNDPRALPERRTDFDIGPYTGKGMDDALEFVKTAAQDNVTLEFRGMPIDVTIFVDPSRGDIQRLLREHGVCRAWASADGQHLVAWDAGLALHATVADGYLPTLGWAGKDNRISLEIWGDRSVRVTDATRHTSWFHNPEIADALMNSQALRRALGAPPTEVTYFDEDVVGPWHEMIQAKTAASFGPSDIPTTFWVVLDLGINNLGSAPQFFERAIKDLENGVVTGIKGISDTGQIVRQFGYRGAFLRMPGMETVELNRLSRVLYGNPDYLCSKNLAALFRIWDHKPDTELGRNGVMHNIAIEVIKRLKDEINATAGHDLHYYGAESDAGRAWSVAPVDISSPQALSRWLYAEFARSWGLHRNNGINFTQADIHEAVQKALAGIGRIYQDEGEWLVKNGLLRIPHSSTLVVGLDSLTAYKKALAWFENLTDEERSYEQGRATPSWDYRDYLRAKALSEGILRLRNLPFQVSFVDGPKLTQHLRELTVKAVTNPKPKAALFTRSTS